MDALHYLCSNIDKYIHKLIFGYLTYYKLCFMLLLDSSLASVKTSLYEEDILP